MRKIGLFVLVLACLTARVEAGPGGCTTEGSLFQFADEGAGITVSSTAIALTATIYAPAGQPPADLAVCTVATDSIMVRADGRAPTSTTGFPYDATASAKVTFTVCGTVNIRRFLAIRVTTDANLKCAYSRKGDQ